MDESYELQIIAEYEVMSQTIWLDALKTFCVMQVLKTLHLRVHACKNQTNSLKFRVKSREFNFAH